MKLVALLLGRRTDRQIVVTMSVLNGQTGFQNTNTPTCCACYRKYLQSANSWAQASRMRWAPPLGLVLALASATALAVPWDLTEGREQFNGHILRQGSNEAGRIVIGTPDDGFNKKRYETRAVCKSNLRMHSCCTGRTKGWNEGNVMAETKGRTNRNSATAFVHCTCGRQCCGPGRKLCKLT